ARSLVVVGRAACLRDRLTISGLGTSEWRADSRIYPQCVNQERDPVTPRIYRDANSRPQSVHAAHLVGGTDLLYALEKISLARVDVSRAACHFCGDASGTRRLSHARLYLALARGRGRD